MTSRLATIALLTIALAGCKKSEPAAYKTGSASGTGSASASGTGTGTGTGTASGSDGHSVHDGHGHDAPKVVQVTPPFDVKAPPADAEQTASGLRYKVITVGTGAAPGKNDAVKIKYSAWRQDGTTFATTEPGNEPTTMLMYSTAPGFREGLLLMKIGGRAMFWLPPDPADPKGEMLSYAVELVEVVAAPKTPPDVAKAPGDARKEKSGVSWKKTKSNPKGAKPRAWDKVSMSYTGWDETGTIVDSSEVHGKPLDVPLERLPGVFGDVVPKLAVGERARLWFPAALLGKNPSKPADAVLCFEVEVHAVTQLVQAPDAPPDVAQPPADALTTPKGVSYKVLKAGPGGAKPQATEKVRVNYTGWTTDGKRFDSSIPEGKPSEFEVTGVIPGWTDALLLMSVGDTWRIWVPAELAYKGAPQRPQGMLVFDVTLEEILGSKVEFTPPP